MTNKIGENINKLRKKHSFTQQQLSDILGVSVAAISKWETGVAYPDIELLPKIATIFDVSIDYFFDFRLVSAEDNINVIENANNLFETGKVTEAVSMLSDALLRYPNDIHIKFNIAKMMIYSNTKPEPNIEIITLLKDVINNCEIRTIIDESYYLLCIAYINLHDYSKAEAAINQIHLSSHINTGISLLRIYFEQGNIDSAMKQFEVNLYLSLANIYSNTLWVNKIFKDDSEKAISFYKMAIDTFRAYCGENACRFDAYISIFYEKAASVYAKMKKFDKAIDLLKMAVKYGNSYDNLPCGDDLPQFDKLDIADTGWNKINNQKLLLLNTIESKLNDDYRELKTSSDFTKIVTALNNSI